MPNDADLREKGDLNSDQPGSFEKAQCSFWSMDESQPANVLPRCTFQN